MKKQFFFIYILTSFFALPSVAQIKKGAIFLGGDIGGSTQKSTYSNSPNTDKQSSFYIAPVFGKAIKENLVFGVNASVRVFNSKTTGTANENKQHSYGASIFLRKYKQIGKSGFSLFAQGNLGYFYNSSKLNSLTPNYNNDKRNTISINVAPGISYTLTRKLQLEAGLANLLSLNYTTEKSELGGIVPAFSKTNGFNISSSIDGSSSVYIGFRVLLN